MEKYYKIMERGPSGGFMTLFHGVNGSRYVPAKVWYRADIKHNVKDGTSKTSYTSGWHVLPTLEEAREYLKRFKCRLDKLCIVECNIGNKKWAKHHSPSNVWLAEDIYLLGEVA